MILMNEMSHRSIHFTNPIDIKIFCGSYNLHAKHKLDDGCGLEQWLCPSGVAEADIYVLSFQEIVQLNAVNVTVDVKGSKMSSYWEETILSCLNNYTNGDRLFIHVASKQLVGALICVFIREKLRPYCRDVRTASTACGVMGVMGNKGGVVVRMKLYNRYVNFLFA
jgi:phosphatidylinositol-bisphosphatase